MVPSGQPTETSEIVTSVSGLPSPGPLALSEPSAATSSRMATPASSMVPKTV